MSKDQLLGQKIISERALSGGCIADVSLAALSDGRRVVLKRRRTTAPKTFEIEARMLRYLSEHTGLPLPAVLTVTSDLLVLSYIPHRGNLTMKGEADLAAHVAALHNVTAELYGLEFDTVIASLPQVNSLSDDWVEFFRERRLLAMTKSCADEGLLTPQEQARLSHFCEKLDELIPCTPSASLLHGDLWGGNILGDGDHVAGFVDPAIYYGDAEMDLAFLSLFASVGERFYDAYHEQRAIPSEFFELRRDIYNLWPLLVHVRLFGRSYWRGIDNVLTQHGC